MSQIDAHQHYWRISRGDYGWLTPDRSPLYRNFLPCDLEPSLALAAIDGTVLVQAAPTVDETRDLLRQSGTTPSIRGVVGWVPLDDANLPDVLDKLGASPAFVGVRPMLENEGALDWFLRDDVARGIDRVDKRELCFDALITPAHLRHMPAFLRRHPNLRVVIDHAAKPAADLGRGWPGFDNWAQCMRALAQDPRVHCKLSGLLTEAGPGWSVAQLRPFVDVLLESFGPARLLWGSDWPVVLEVASYLGWYETSRSLLSELSVDERGAIFGGNAIEFYGLE